MTIYDEIRTVFAAAAIVAMTGCRPSGPLMSNSSMSPPEPVETALLAASSANLADYSPAPLIAAVNALIPLGKEDALDAIVACRTGSDGRDPQLGLFLVLRVLFEVPASRGHHPPMQLGASAPPPPPDPSSLPAFPLMIVDDVPLLLVRGYQIAGAAESVDEHIARFRNDAVYIRSLQLRPHPTPRTFEDYWRRYRAAYGIAPSPTEVEFVQAQLDQM